MSMKLGIAGISAMKRTSNSGRPHCLSITPPLSNAPKSWPTAGWPFPPHGQCKSTASVIFGWRKVHPGACYSALGSNGVLIRTYAFQISGAPARASVVLYEDAGNCYDSYGHGIGFPTVYYSGCIEQRQIFGGRGFLSFMVDG